MKKISRILFLAVLVIPILTVSTVKANGGASGKDGSLLQTILQDIFGGSNKTPSPGNGGGSNSGGGTRVPLDGGLSLLLVAGVGLGMKKAFPKKAVGEGNEHS